MELMSKLIQGDSKEEIKRIEDNIIDLTVTDPPYDVNYGNKSEEMLRMFPQQQKRLKQIERDSTYVEHNIDYDSFAEQLYRVHKDNSHVYIFCGDLQYPIWYYAMLKAGFKFRTDLIWVKNAQTLDMTCGLKYAYKTEHCIYFGKGTRKLNYINRNNVLTYKIPADRQHPTQKPLDMIKYLVLNSSKPKELVFDPFMGSGTTPLAAKLLDRGYIGVELSEKYYKVAENRLNQPRMDDYVTPTENLGDSE